MRYLYLAETPVIEIQEAKGDGNKDLWISLGNMEFQYARGTNTFYQYMDWPSNKEIKERQEELKAITDEDKKEEAAKAFMQWMKETSKKVVYNITTPNGNLSNAVDAIIGDNEVTLEYLD